MKSMGKKPENTKASFFIFVILIFTVIPILMLSEEISLVRFAEQGDLEEVKKLIARGVDVNSQTGEGATALMMAAKNGHADIIKLLIAGKADVNAKGSEYGITALMIAAENDQPGSVRILIASGADINAKMHHLGLTALILACGKGNVEVAKILIDNQADVSAKTPEGATALFAAIETGQIDIVKMLLEKGADVNVKMADGKTPLMIAEKGGNPEMVRLLKQGASKLPEKSEALASELSADVAVRINKETVTGKYYAKENKFRLETAGQSEYIVIRRDLNILWVVNPQDKSYLEMPISEMKGPIWWEYSTGMQKIEEDRELLDSEVVDTHPAQKYIVVLKVGGKTERIFQWQATDIDCVVKQAAVDGSWSVEYLKIKKSATSALFEIPSGFRKISIFQELDKND